MADTPDDLVPVQLQPSHACHIRAMRRREELRTSRVGVMLSTRAIAVVVMTPSPEQLRGLRRGDHKPCAQ